jgi:hypothetical protein
VRRISRDDWEQMWMLPEAPGPGLLMKARESSPWAVAEGPAMGAKTLRADCRALAVCALVGLVLALLPHCYWWPRIGQPYWINDSDEVLYLSVAARAYHDHPTYLSDPVRASYAPTLYPWLQYVPAIVTARLLGWGPLGISLVWRIWAGLTIPTAFYLVLRHYLRRPIPACALAVFLTADVGTGMHRLIYKQIAWLIASVAILRHQPHAELHYLCPLWRLITPALSLGFLLLHLWLLARARERPSWGHLASSGLGFGLLFHVYFYYWTAAGLALLMASALDAGHRRVYFHTGWIGGLVGLPTLISNFLIRRSTSPEALPRNDLFLPIARGSELWVPTATIVLLVLGLIWVWARRRDLMYLWCLDASALALTNHQVVTGLQIQNFHWEYVWGVGTSLLFVLLVAGEMERWTGWSPPVLWVVGIACGLTLVSGVWLRYCETLRSQESLKLAACYRQYRAQRLAPGVPRLAPHAVVAGDLDFVNLAVILENQRPLSHYTVAMSLDVPNAEWHERRVLNDLILGRTRAEADALDKSSQGWGPWCRDPELRRRTVAECLTDYDRFAADPAAAFLRFGVRYVALPAGQVAPDYLRSGWTQLQAGPSWQLWERTADRP